MNIFLLNVATQGTGGTATLVESDLGTHIANGVVMNDTAWPT